MPVPYFHQVFTLPTPIADIAYQNKALIYDLLFKASAEAMLAIAADPKHLGARIGFIAVLHTWGSAMTHHPHVHMIAPGGGLSPDGEHKLRGLPYDLQYLGRARLSPARDDAQLHHLVLQKFQRPARVAFGGLEQASAAEFT